jgi:YegS/Rv2252/BmrU family lipid kinase
MLHGTFDKALLVANPISGSCTAARWLPRVTAEFEAAGCHLETLMTRRAGDAKEAAAAAGPNSLVVAFGGDGTYNEVLNGADLEGVTLAVIPAGAGNVFAKELGMSWHPLQAARQLLRGHVVRLDVGALNGRRFASVFGAGIDAWVVKAVHERRGRGMTQWHYAPHVVWGLVQPLSWEMEVEVDGRPFADDLDQVAVGNTHSYGGPMEMTPAATPADGRFDIMCARRRDLPDVVSLMLCGFLRRLHRSRRVRYGRGMRVHVTSRRPGVPCEVDGEPAGTLPAEITMLPGAAKVLAPAGFRALPPR